MTLSMPHSHKIISSPVIMPAWLSRLLASKPKHMAQPRCACGRFCAENAQKSEQKIDPILAERLANGQSVPTYFVRGGEQ